MPNKKLKGLLLISSGIDSPVAGYLMKKQNVDITGIHFDNQPFTNEMPLEKTKKLLKKLKINKLYIVEYGKNQVEIIKNCIRKFQCVLCRRMMFKVAEKIAEKEKCEFLITGENLAQVASQTLDNLTVEDKAVKIPILRPLLCNDKQETVDLAKKIETYEISIEPGMCCNMVPKHPATKSTLEKIEKEENKLNIQELINNSVKNMKVIHI